MEDRKTLHHLVDSLPEPELPAAKRFLEYLQQASDPLWLSLKSAPLDDEPTSDDDRAAIREGLGESARGETMSQEQVELLFSRTG